jgi:hypothetical protein
VIGLIATGSRSRAQEKPLPEEVIRSLADNAAQLSPIEVAWTDQASTSLTPGQLLSIYNIDDADASDLFRDTLSERVGWQDGKIYTWQSSKIGQSVTEASSDGKIKYGGTFSWGPANSDRSPQLGKALWSNLVKVDPNASYFNLAYFSLVGIDLPSRCLDIVEGKPPRSIIVSRMEAGATVKDVSSVMLDGRSLLCIRLISDNTQFTEARSVDLTEKAAELKRRGVPEQAIQNDLNMIIAARQMPPKVIESYYLDPTMNYALRRSRLGYEDGRTLEEATSDEFSQLGNRKVWLPHQGKASLYTWGGILQVSDTPIVTHSYTVSSIKLDRIPESRFVLTYTTPGTRVIDKTIPGARIYTVPAQPATLDSAVEKAKALTALPAPPVGVENTSDRAMFWTLIIAANVVGICIAAVAILHKIRNRQRPH